MRVLIVAKTRQGAGACVGGISFDGRSVRLIAADAATNPRPGLQYEVGDVWELDAAEPEELLPPHVENIVVQSGRRLGPMTDPVPFIERWMPPAVGGAELLFEGRTRRSEFGALYVDAAGIPRRSTMFWRPDKPLQRDLNSRRVRYRYGDESGCTLTFVGFQEPVESLPAGTLVRVSLAHWWRPPDRPHQELRCYVQLSGWFPYQVARSASGDCRPAREPAPPASPAPPAPPHPTDPTDPLLTRLRQVFGYESFRPFQEQIIRSVVAGRDTLGILPTGSGKSLCFQLPALAMSGLTVVVSPLIALMQDQVDQLRLLGVPAVFLNSSQTHSEYLAAARQVREGVARLLYVAPETLVRPEILVMFDQVGVACFTIDEAHCISSWGHDFRPEYRKLLDVRRRYPRAVCLALTATATARVQRDIRETLGFSTSQTFVASFDRPNLYFSASRRVDGLGQILAFLKDRRGQAGIIYCPTRDQTDRLAEQLAAEGYPALPYHAGMVDGARKQNQRRFIREEGQVMVATVAFGMGINKPDVRFIVHNALPDCIETYYQQVGRAGRDGERADCLLLHSLADVRQVARMIDQGAASERPGRMARLQAMQRYAATLSCRRSALLAYFDEKYPEGPCGMCDNCRTAAEEAPQAEDVTEPASRLIRAVLATGESFGIVHVISVLRGSRAQRILARRHDRLDVHGSGKDLSEGYWRQLSNRLFDLGLLTQDEEHGSVRLTPAGRRVLAGERVLAVMSEPGAGPERPEITDYDPALFELLRRHRRALADAAGVPAYVVFADRTLRDIARDYPRTPRELLRAHGMGGHKLSLYGEALLKLIDSYCREQGIGQAKRYGPAPETQEGIAGERSFEIARLHRQGASVADLAARCGVKRTTIIGHLEAAARAGFPLDPDRLLADVGLDPATLTEALRALSEPGPIRLSLVFEALKGRVSYDDLRLLRTVLACRQSAPE